MLSIHNISISYSIQPILVDVSFNINPGDRIGLIGPNGCGKTTLLRILSGLETPDAGVVTRGPGLRLGYLPQGLVTSDGATIAEVLNQRNGDPDLLEAEIVQLAAALADDPDNLALQKEYDTALTRLASSDQSGRKQAILSALGLAGIRDERSIETLSGGQKTRLALAAVLIEDPNLLLLDEPTNHLDIEMLEWLEAWLANFHGAALIVSHDRTFLDRSVNRILDLNQETRSVKEYAGNYSDYLEEYLGERQKQLSTYRDQVVEIRRMRDDIQATKQHSLRVELTTTSRQPGVRRYAKKVAKKAKSREKKLQRFLSDDERVEKPRQTWQMKLEFEDPQHQSQDILILEKLSIGYPGAQLLLNDLDLRVKAGDRIVLTGPNGCGKTTLLETIAGRREPLRGKVRLGASSRLGYMSQEGDTLDLNLSPLEVIQRHAPLNETDARTTLHKFLFSGDDALRPAAQLSYGERARLALALLIVQGCNLLLLDEPINHLDIPSRTRFEQALAGFSGTILAVVHDRYFIERFATQLWVMDQEVLIH
jgi:ATP-binding cassette, subfamily F, member 3